MIGAVIFYYHRVLPTAPRDPLGIMARWQLHVELAHFRYQVELIARRFRVITLDELLTQLDSGSVRPGQAVITFDDGYADNYWHAFPVLRRLGVPATIFLTTANVEHGMPFWWDRLAWTATPGRPDVLALPEELGGNVVDVSSPERLRDVILTLHRRLRTMPPTVRERMLERLGAPARIADGGPLTWNQAREMAREGILFGAHTMHHPSLVEMPDEILSEEIGGSRRLIAGRLGHSPVTFAYPFGHTDSRVRRAIELQGFRGAVGMDFGVCESAAAAFHLPRVLVRNWNNAYFRRYVDVLVRTGLSLGEPGHHLKSALKSVLPIRLLAAYARRRAQVLDG